MKGSTQAAFAIGVGYLLGRRRKLRTATLMAGGMAVGAVGGIGGMALRRGAKVLGNTEVLSKVSPQLGEIADTVRNDLLDAGKAAAMAAVTGRIDSLTGTLHDRAETLRNPVDKATGEVGKTAGRAGKAAGGAAGRLRRRGRPAEDDEAVEAEEYEDAPLDEEEPRARDERDELDEEEEEPRRRGEADLEDEYDEGYEADDEAEDVADDEEAAEPVDEDEDEPEARPRRSRQARTRSPVSRTRR